MANRSSCSYSYPSSIVLKLKRNRSRWHDLLLFVNDAARSAWIYVVRLSASVSRMLRARISNIIDENTKYIILVSRKNPDRATKINPWPNTITIYVNNNNIYSQDPSIVKYSGEKPLPKLQWKTVEDFFYSKIDFFLLHIFFLFKSEETHVTWKLSDKYRIISRWTRNASASSFGLRKIRKFEQIKCEKNPNFDQCVFCHDTYNLFTISELRISTVL